MTLTIYYDNAIVYAHSQQTEQTCRNEYNGTENRVKDKRRKKIQKAISTYASRWRPYVNAFLTLTSKSGMNLMVLNQKRTTWCNTKHYYLDHNPLKAYALRSRGGKTMQKQQLNRSWQSQKNEIIQWRSTNELRFYVSSIGGNRE